MDKVREAALLTLCSIDRENAFVNMALKDTLHKNRDFSPQDRAFITAIVYGTVRRRITIDYIIERNSKVRLKKISPYILNILRMGIYQIKFMDKVPENAAVNESVKLAKRYGHGASAGFVNAMLRNIAKNEIDYPKEHIKNLCVKYSFPEWICRLWIESYGEAFAKELMESMNRDAKVILRVNTLKTTPQKLAQKLPEGEVSKLYENAVIAKGFDVENSEEYKNGEFIAQDISAMMASCVLAPKPGECVLDICAAPGGKTTHLAQIMENRGEIYACDIHEHKLKIIEKNAHRMGMDIIKTKQADAAVLNEEWLQKFDKILADVPCSGLGIIRKKPDIKLKSKDDGISEIQYKILSNAAKYLKTGGELVYSTCTLNRAENESIIEKFLENNSGFCAVSIKDNLPKPLKKDEAEKGYVTFYPNIDGIDGFFIAKIKRCTDD